MRKSLLFALFVALPLGAAPIIQLISPASGPAAGGTEVTIKGSFDAAAAPLVIFGDEVPAASTRVVDAQTLVAVTPEHIPGVATVWVRQGTAQSDRTQKFAFVGEAPSYERILIPTFTLPVHGAFGSEFRTTLRLWSSTDAASIYGLDAGPADCPVLCEVWNPLDTPLRVPGDPHADDAMPRPLGNPGRFVYIHESESSRVMMNLRVADITRDFQNFGTEIPVVHADDFFINEPIALLGVPLDPRFRNTLRIYSTEPIGVFVNIGGEERFVMLQRGADLFEPAYAVVSNFPTGTGTIRVTITPPAGSPNTLPPPPPPPPLWAFISVTNNDTQMITTITPQR